MHPEVIANKPGKCPKCGMTLVKVEAKKVKETITDVYTCTMHPEVISDKPGKCPKCGMTLVKVEKAK
jgi:Cu(I)/Ag(I) efflux system membrane fusion protein